MNKIFKNPIHILGLTVSTIGSNPIILYPIFVLACIQIFVLEIIYFAPRYPMSPIIEPFIQKVINTGLIHYPYNYILLSKWYYNVDPYIYIFINGFFYANIVLIVYFIDKNRTIDFRRITKHALASYVQLVLAMILSVLSLKSLSYLYGFLIKRAGSIRSTTGVYYLIKKAVISSAPYMHFLFASLIVALLAFVIPIMVIEQKNVFIAVKINFSKYGGSFWLILGVCVVSSLLYLPFLLYRLFLLNKCAIAYPEISGFILAASILTMLLIDAIQFTAITLCYLSYKEK